MDKIKCEVVRDLMPLVADDVASEESKELVNGHMESCPDCRQVFEIMARRLPAQEETESETKFIRFCRKLEKKLRWQKVVLWSVIAVILVAVILCGQLFLGDLRDACKDMPASWVDMTLETDENGWVSVKCTMLDGRKYNPDCGYCVYFSGTDTVYITPSIPILPNNSRSTADTFYLDSFDSLRVLDGTLKKVDREHSTVYDPEINAYLDHAENIYTDIVEVYVGAPDDPEKKLIWKEGDEIPTNPNLSK